MAFRKDKNWTKDQSLTKKMEIGHKFVIGASYIKSYIQSQILNSGYEKKFVYVKKPAPSDS